VTTPDGSDNNITDNEQLDDARKVVKATSKEDNMDRFVFCHPLRLYCIVILIENISLRTHRVLEQVNFTAKFKGLPEFKPVMLSPSTLSLPSSPRLILNSFRSKPKANKCGEFIGEFIHIRYNK